MWGMRGLSCLLAFRLLQELPLLEACEQPMGSPRIVGGNDAKNGSWPWQVSIREGSNHICGGSLIAESWVVSAAHCFNGDKSAYHVNLGEYQLQNPSESLVSFPIKEIYRHPSYTDIGSSGDIALVELETPVNFNRVIRPICLPASSVEFPAGMECWVTGWGDTQYGGSLTAPKTLQEVQVPLIDRDTCNSLFNTGSYPDDPQGTDPIKQDMICAGYPQEKKDACQGDSGGPLVCEWDNAWLLAGVVSWGVECARPNRPGVYILLPPYADWIQGYVPTIPFTVRSMSVMQHNSAAASPLGALRNILGSSPTHTRLKQVKRIGGPLGLLGALSYCLVYLYLVPPLPAMLLLAAAVPMIL
ncbi:serine protease 27-like [Trachemys scripta elegans]|uniref:serine protease 27-like n=1 Tax=Trachemys scripta elegans TaxID=31138 RepID=UPI001556F328|nr:serine protease 27-like [Trachemys scripta elegans]